MSNLQKIIFINTDVLLKTRTKFLLTSSVVTRITGCDFHNIWSKAVDGTLFTFVFIHDAQSLGIKLNYRFVLQIKKRRSRIPEIRVVY